jgi:hypothetical protein
VDDAMGRVEEHMTVEVKVGPDTMGTVVAATNRRDAKYSAP